MIWCQTYHKYKHPFDYFLMKIMTHDMIYERYGPDIYIKLQL